METLRSERVAYKIPLKVKNEISSNKNAIKNEKNKRINNHKKLVLKLKTDNLYIKRF